MRHQHSHPNYSLGESHDSEELASAARRLAFEEAEPPIKTKKVLHTGAEIALAIYEDVEEMLAGPIQMMIRGMDQHGLYSAIYFLFVYATEHPDEAKDILAALKEMRHCDNCDHTQEENALLCDLYDRTVRLYARRVREAERIEYVAGQPCTHAKGHG